MPGTQLCVHAGLHVRFGFVARLYEDASLVHYTVHSRGRYCENRGIGFLAEADFGFEECRDRCTLAPTCAFWTIYETGWCQLNTRCKPEGVAGDASVTFMKVGWTAPITGGKHVLCRDVPDFIPRTYAPPQECLGGWTGRLGAPLKYKTP